MGLQPNPLVLRFWYGTFPLKEGERVKKIAGVLGALYLLFTVFGAGYFWRYYQDKAYPEVHILQQPLELETDSEVPAILPEGTALYHEKRLFSTEPEYYCVYLSVKRPLPLEKVDKPYLIAPLSTRFIDE